MKERFKRLPEALQKQVIYRLGAGVIFLLCTILILIFFRDIYLLLPALCFAVFFILNGLWVFFETDAGKYPGADVYCRFSGVLLRRVAGAGAGIFMAV